MIPWHGLIPYFNPLPRKEGDIVHLNDAWNNRGHFNPLPRKEGDVAARVCDRAVKRFQSTPS